MSDDPFLKEPGEPTRHKRKCTAQSARSKKPCSRWAIAGGTVCPTHGGSAPQVKRKAQERLQDLIDPDRVLRSAAEIAHLDIGVFYDSNNKLLPLKDWPENARRAVQSFEVIRGNRDAGDGKFDEVVKLKLWDKMKSLDILFKHLNLYKEKVEYSGGIEVKWKGEVDE